MGELQTQESVVEPPIFLPPPPSITTKEAVEQYNSTVLGTLRLWGQNSIWQQIGCCATPPPNNWVKIRKKRIEEKKKKNVALIF